MNLQEALEFKKDQVQQMQRLIHSRDYTDKEWATQRHSLFQSEVAAITDYMTGKCDKLGLPECLDSNGNYCVLYNGKANPEC